MTDKGNMPQQHGQVQDFMDPMRNPGLLSTHYQLYSLTNLHPIPNHAAPETHVAATRAPSLSLPFLNNPIKEHYEFLGPPSDEPKFDGDLDFKKTLQALVSRNPALAPLIDPPRMKISQFEDFMREYLQIYFRERYDGHNGTSSCPVPFTHPGHLWNETLEKQGPVFLNIISEYKQEAIKQWERDMKRTLEKLLKDRSISQPALQGSEPLQDREDRVLNAIQIVDSSMETGAARGITTDTPGVPLPAADTKPPSKHQNLSMLCPLFEHGGETLRPRLESCQDRLFDTLSTLKSHAISHVAPYRCAGLGCKNAYAEMKGLNRHQRTQLKNPNCRKAGMDEGMNSPAARDMVQKLHGLNLPQRPVNCPEKMEKYQRDLEDIRGDLKNIVSEYTLKDPAAKDIVSIIKRRGRNPPRSPRLGSNRSLRPSSMTASGSNDSNGAQNTGQEDEDYVMGEDVGASSDPNTSPTSTDQESNNGAPLGSSSLSIHGIGTRTPGLATWSAPGTQHNNGYL